MPSSFEPDTMNGRRPDDEHDPLLGTLLDGRYHIEQRIATGGFGAVYRARTARGELVALKILHPRLTADSNMVARFQREGATLIQLHDPHTVATHQVGETPDGTLYIAMELLTGESLLDRLRRVGALPWRAAVAIARAVCSSLAEAHALGIVHRDLKPSNIHVESRGGHEIVKVIDFGIVKIARGSSIDDGQELTFAGHMIGTYDYMSPEQILGAPCHDRSDLYSLGVVLYEMLTGRRPFPKVTSPAAMMTALLTQTPIRPAALAVIPPELDRIVVRCLERDPQDRFASVVELARALDQLAGRAAGDGVAIAHRGHGLVPPEPDVATYRETPGRDDASSTHREVPGRDEPSTVTYRDTPGRDEPDRSGPSPQATSGPHAAVVDDERTWIDRGDRLIDDRAGAAPAAGPAQATPRPVAAPRPLTTRPAASLATTLRGVAVAPGLVRRNPPASRAPRPAPFEWPPVPHGASRTPPAPHGPRALGSSGDIDRRVDPPARSYALLWIAIALALAGITATVLTAML